MTPDPLGFATIYKLPTLLTPAVDSDDRGVGVYDFAWVKSANHPSIPAGSYASFTNMNSMRARLLFANGALPLLTLTCIDPADEGYDALLVGNDSLGGTRLIAEAVANYGFNQVESQYQPNTSTGTITGTAFVGDVGYASGTSVANSLNRPLLGNDSASGVPYLFVGYVGRNDIPLATSGSTPGTVLGEPRGSGVISHIFSGIKHI